jgi:hypothetical protein
LQRWNRSANDDRLFEQAPFEVERRGIAYGGIALSLEIACERQKTREEAWRAAGNTSRMPPEPLEPPLENGTRREREIWRKIAHGRARVVFMPNGKFDELRAAYAMNDADLWRTVSQREEAAIIADGEA